MAALSVPFPTQTARRALRPQVPGAGERIVRLRGVWVLAGLWAALIVARLVSLQISDFSTWQTWARRQHNKEIQVAAERGPILDRYGRNLAVSVPAGSVYIRPKDVTNKKLVVEKLSYLLGVRPQVIIEKLNSTQPFVWVKRQIPRQRADLVERLGLAGVGMVLESRRFYPYNQAASALIGKVGVDGNGLSGLEAMFERQLTAAHGTETMVRDARGAMIDTGRGDAEALQVPRGSSISLTIDADLQMIMDDALETGRKASKAKNAFGVMIDADTGEVLSLGQTPMVNFNSPTVSSKNDLKLALVETVFEPGSIFKPIVASAALEERLVSPNELINCEGGRFKFGRNTIKDDHPAKVVPFSQVVIRSSNIGMTKVGTRLGADRLYEYLRKFGIGQSTKLGLPGESSGILRPVSKWARIDLATHSFGQGVAVTPLQMVRAFAAFGNGGVLPQLKVVLDGKPPQTERVISERASAQIREMLYGVVEDEHGTGKRAGITGVRVGGKTGTAQKASTTGRGYRAGAYVASFVGFVDARVLGIQKTYALLISVDEPKAGSIYGGLVAAPVFKDVMQRSLNLLATREELRSGTR